VQLTLYYSRDAARPAPQLQAYAARVREMLLTFQARSHGRVRFTEVNVEPLHRGRRRGVWKRCIQAVRPYEGADPIYFGLVGANAIDDTRTLSRCSSPQREAFLEYELTRLIYELENPERTRMWR
jgi:ABC-2 type transport system permease protein